MGSESANLFSCACDFDCCVACYGTHHFLVGLSSYVQSIYWFEMTGNTQTHTQNLFVDCRIQGMCWVVAVVVVVWWRQPMRSLRTFPPERTLRDIDQQHKNEELKRASARAKESQCKSKKTTLAQKHQQKKTSETRLRENSDQQSDTVYLVLRQSLATEWKFQAHAPQTPL